MSESEGAEFKLWGGEVYGENLEVKRNSRLVQSWYGGDWEDAPHVIINLKEDRGDTVIELIHTNLPINEIESFEKGWDEYYFGPTKKLLEVAN